jgi:glycosyltransferase involved in cell wall biosynthesis
MPFQPYISIIIPAYNAAAWISDALESCVRQRHNSCEIIVVDDGSTDDTYSVATRCACANADFVHILRTANKGASAARNIGRTVAKGEYVLFLDADDILANGALEALGSIAAQTGADAVFGSHSNFNHRPGRERSAPRKLKYRDDYANAVQWLWVQGSVLLRNTDLRWNESRVLWEGMEYILDFLADERSVVYTDLIVVWVRQHQSTGRISNRHDHFEPAMTGAFFSEQKSKLANRNGLNFERESALDFRILGNAYALLRVGRRDEADTLFREINWSNVPKYKWYKIGSLPWAGYWAGPRVGTRVFCFANKLIDRA